jgi:phenylalanyl-tRNA synthetase beta chain
MKISLTWLKRYIDVKLSPEALAERLTMQGLEVESIERTGAVYDGFVVGEVLEVARHPNADKLSVCRVSTGKESLQIVCGAPNVAKGQKVAVGLAGAVVPHDQHDPSGAPFTLANVKIRGVESSGMICSAHELGLGDDRDGIMVLAHNARVGAPLASYLGLDDVVFEIGLTPNRPDAMSHFGVAREVGVIVRRKPKLPAAAVKEGKRRADKALAVRVADAALCPRYTARVVFDVKVAPSPEWLQKLLTAVHIRPVNNIVDITNFVMMECGQPLHAFDYDRLEGRRVIVRRATEGEKFVTLDHATRTLKKETLLICDAAKAIAIAGVMGGENSEITASTRNVVIESAYFDPRSVRRTSKYLGLSTDASQRFERGGDVEGTLRAANRAAQLIRELNAGEILKGAVDVYPKKRKAKTIEVRISRVAALLGLPISRQKVIASLASLEINSVRTGSRKQDSVRFDVPSYRPDLEREIDLIEEIARVYGYDNIETRTEARIRFPEVPPGRDAVGEIREALIGFGYQEIVTNSMQEMKVAALASDEVVEIANPISVEMAALRTSLVPSMLRIVRNNIFQGTKDLRFLEIGKVYGHSRSAGKGEFYEKRRILLAASGLSKVGVWDEAPRDVDLFDVRGDLNAFFEKIFLDKFNFIPYPTTKALTQKGLLIEINGVEAGYLGLISKELLRKFEIEQEVVAVELDLDLLLNALTEQRKFRALSRFPSVLRDIALIVDAHIPVGEVEAVIRGSGEPYLKQAQLFDIYSGDQVGAGRKSVAFALEFFSADHTLTQEEVNGVMKNILSRAKSSLRAELRV